MFEDPFVLGPGGCKDEHSSYLQASHCLVVWKEILEIIQSAKCSGRDNIQDIKLPPTPLT